MTTVKAALWSIAGMGLGGVGVCYGGDGGNVEHRWPRV